MGVGVAPRRLLLARFTPADRWNVSPTQIAVTDRTSQRSAQGTKWRLVSPAGHRGFQGSDD